MNNKKTQSALVIGALMASALSFQSAAVEGLSANVGLTSNYLWRGVTQTDDAAAISGGIDYSHSSGFYAGTWVSNVDFGDDASYELDGYFGFSGELTKELSYDVGYIYYAYPDSDKTDSNNQYDFGEIYGSLSYAGFSFAANYGIHNDKGAEWADKALYLAAGYEVEVAQDLTLAVHLGRYDFKDAFNSDDYTDYSISLAKNGFTFAVSDTNRDQDDVKFVVSYSIDIDL